jgi:glycogen debranching enzyme
MLFAATYGVEAQTAQPALASLPAIPFTTDGPVIRAHAEPAKPFTVAGEHGVLVGQQDGSFESWVLPVKLLSHLAIQATVQGYSVPIDVNQQVAEIEVRPDRTTITYSHMEFTVRQIMFSANESVAGAAAQTGPVVLFEFDCLHPTDFTFSFTPELRWMWPERNEGVPDAEWVPTPTGGYYVLHADYPDLAGAVTIPGAAPGILAPYQERPQVHPVELKLHIDPARDHGRLFPLLMAVGTSPATATVPALASTLAQLNGSIAGAYAAHAERYKKLLANSVSIETPDKALNEAFQWAVVSIEQLRAKAVPTGETALVAGYYASADSARPGFGWFFGRDALYTLDAVNGYGDFDLSKAELEFLIHRQRADGKIMHEYSQTAAAIDWRAFPYMYAAADATPLFLLAIDDYVRSSGDTAFLAANREAIEKAWTFETTHDTDGDGIYDNSQGTGWVESWPGGMPHQEVYLALLDQQASTAMAHLEGLLKDPARSAAAQQRAEKVAAAINAEYYDAEKGCYAFSRNADGTLDRTTTVYPAIAWWSGKSILAHPEGCTRQLAAHTLNTDWGLRDISTDEKIYDGTSYHQGSVWPLFTGWAALAEYRAGQPLAGYQMLMENANLTHAQDLGAVTELLSGDFFVPFGRSTSHQLWSSAMVITPTLRGLFGIDIDAQTKTITVNPHLPAGWEGQAAEVKNISVPGGSVSLLFDENAGDYCRVVLDANAVEGWKLRSDLSGSRAEKGMRETLLLPHPPIRIASLGGPAPLAGSRTSATRILSEHWQSKSVSLQVEGPAGSSAVYLIKQKEWKQPRLEVSDGLSNQAEGDKPGALLTFLGIGDPVNIPPYASQLRINFPPGEGWKTITVNLTW